MRFQQQLQYCFPEPSNFRGHRWHPCKIVSDILELAGISPYYVALESFNSGKLFITINTSSYHLLHCNCSHLGLVKGSQKLQLTIWHTSCHITNKPDFVSFWLKPDNWTWSQNHYLSVTWGKWIFEFLVSKRLVCYLPFCTYFTTLIQDLWNVEFHRNRLWEQNDCISKATPPILMYN